MPTPFKIGETIKQARISKSLSQADLARIIEVDQSVISKYENGERDPGSKLLYRIAQALKIDLVIPGK